MPFDTSTRLYSLLAERVNVPIRKEKRSDTICIKPMLFLERVRGIEPPTNAWEALVLPLNYTRLFKKLNFYSFSTVTIDTIAL